MDFVITLNGNDITNKVVTYEREQNICSCIGTLKVSVVPGDDFDIGDTFILNEGGIKKGTYTIGDISADWNGIEMQAQDGSKRMVDYFIPNSYDITTQTTCKYWIEKFLTEAQVSYHFNVSDSGSNVNNNTTLGLKTVYEEVLSLLQASGWYLGFDADNVAQIGKLPLSLSNYKAVYTEADIINIESNKNDKMLRNRSVVWGASNPLTGKWVYADQSVSTSWDYDNNDKRTVVYQNASVWSLSQAYSLGKKLLNELTRITYTKSVTLHGVRNIKIGDIVLIKHRMFSGCCLVTRISSRMSVSGLITQLYLDDRCPRLIGAYVKGLEDHVYIATPNAGVWRKLLKTTHTWENFSSGLTDYNIKDLHIQNGVFSCVSEEGNLFTRTIYDNSWTEFYPGNFITPSGIIYPAPSGICTSTVIDKYTNEILAAYNLADENVYGSWLARINPDMSYTKKYIQKITPGEIEPKDVKILDIEHNGNTDILLTKTKGSALSLEQLYTPYWYAVKDTPNIVGDILETYNIDSGYTETGEVVQGRSGEYVFSKFYTSNPVYSYTALKRINFITNAVDIISLGDFVFDNMHYLQCLVPLSDTQCIMMIVNYGEAYPEPDILNAYLVDWTTGTITYRATTSHDSYIDTQGYATIIYNGSVRIILGWTTNGSGYVAGVDFTIYDTGTNVFSTVVGPLGSDDCYVVSRDTYSIGWVEPSYPWSSVDLGNGTVGLILASNRNIPYDRPPWNTYLAIIDTNNGTGIFTLSPGSMNNPSIVGDYVYEISGSTDGTDFVAPNYSDNSFVVILYKYTCISTYYSWNDTGFGIFKMSQDGTITSLYLQEYTDSDWIMPVALLYNKTKIFWWGEHMIGTGGPLDSDNYEFYNLTDGNQLLFTKDALNGEYYMYDTKISPHLGDTNNEIIWIRDDYTAGHWFLQKLSTTGVETTLYDYGIDSYSNNFDVPDHLRLIDHMIDFYAYSGTLWIHKMKSGEVGESYDILTPTSVSGIVINENDYSSIQSFAFPYRLENSQSSPLILFNYWDIPNNPGTFEFVYIKPTYSSPFIVSEDKIVRDARSFNTISGEQPKEYILYPEIETNDLTRSNLVLIDIIGLQYETPNVIFTDGTLMSPRVDHMIQISGIINHIETSNYEDSPYIFYSVSGGKFYQRDSFTVDETDPGFIEHSPNLEINCIRIDDLI